MLDVSQPVTTRDGREARILATDGRYIDEDGNNRSLVVETRNKHNDRYQVGTRHPSGQVHATYPCVDDIINVPKNIFRHVSNVIPATLLGNPIYEKPHGPSLEFKYEGKALVDVIYHA